MSATIAPTPLGADNLLASQALDMTVTDYVFNYHAKASIPIILVLAIVHYVWQRYMDKKEIALAINQEMLVNQEERSTLQYSTSIFNLTHVTSIINGYF